MTLMLRHRAVRGEHRAEPDDAGHAVLARLLCEAGVGLRDDDGPARHLVVPEVFL